MYEYTMKQKIALYVLAVLTIITISLPVVMIK